MNTSFINKEKTLETKNQTNSGNRKTKVIVDTVNLFQFFGWTLTLNLILVHLFLKLSNNSNSDKILGVAILIAKITQTFGGLEILLALLKISSSSVFTTFTQFLSRMTVIFIFLSNNDTTSTICFFLIPWSVADATRSLYYVYKDSRLLGQLRYNLFLILYPIGCAGEVMLMEQRIRGLKGDTNNLYYVIRSVQVLFFMGLVVLYSHLLKQRKKFYKALNVKKIN
jgi:very-long-chain (3R)-3-hydroxyacyl-CoA dehydratase